MRRFYIAIAIIIFFTGIVSPVTAQRQSENWVFGAYNYLSFREGRPQLLDSMPFDILGMPPIGIGGVVSMSNADGRLLFFGDKYELFNRYGQRMVPRLLNDLYFLAAQSNAVIAIPQPDDLYRYFYFYMGHDNDEARRNRKLAYLTIDMRLNNGLGAVLPGRVEYHNYLDRHKQDVAVKITAAKHCNNRDYWVISHYLNTNEYCSYLITKDGVSEVPVISNGVYVPDISRNKKNEHGMLKVSPAGNSIAAAWGGESQIIEIGDFDNVTGKITNFRLVEPTLAGIELPFGLAGDNKLHGIYGVDFSPSGRYLYVSGTTDINPPVGDPLHNSGNYYRLSFLMQYANLKANGIDIKSTERIIDTAYHSAYEGMQTGPDGNLYIVDGWFQKLYALENPDEPVATGSMNRQPLGNKHLEYNFGNLPAFVQSWVRFPIIAKGNCERQFISFSIKNTIGVDSVHWVFGDELSGVNNYANTKEASHLFTAEGWYHVKAVVFSHAACAPDTVAIGVYAGKFTATILGNRGLCIGDSLRLFTNNNAQKSIFQWSTGDTVSSLIIKEPGRFSVKVNEGACAAYDTVIVEQFKQPKYLLAGDTSICENSKIEIGMPTAENGVGYLWNTGAVSSFIKVYKAGKYILKVTGDGGCSYSDSVQVYVKPLPYFSLGTDTFFCSSQSLPLALTHKFDSAFWNIGSRGNRIDVSLPGVYACTTYLAGCDYADSINIDMNETPVFSFGTDTTLCDGTVLHLKVPVEDADSFRWSSQHTGNSIQIQNAGRYWLDVSRKGCSWRDTIDVKVNATPQIRINAQLSICPPQRILLQPDLYQGDGVRWLWSTGSQAAEITVDKPSAYKVTVSNVCGYDEKEITIVTGECELKLPNAFSPNADGINDLFFAKGVDAVSNFSLMVFDRYGKKVFSSLSTTERWDGRYKGQVLPAGTYYWVCSYQQLGGVTKKQFRGSVLLLY